MNTSLTALFRLSILFLVAVVSRSTGAAADPEFYYYYRGAKRALVLDESAVAVKLASHASHGRQPDEKATKEVASRAAALGYKAEEVSSFRPGGWLKLETKSAVVRLDGVGQGRKEKHKRLMDDLATLEDVEFAAPIFKDDNGQPVHFEATILVGFFEGTSEAVQSDTLKKILKTKAARRHAPKNGWTVQTTFTNGLDLLDAANELAALPFVRYADPNFVLTARLL